jgi:Domain of unknown function (DUF4352)
MTSTRIVLLALVTGAIALVATFVLGRRDQVAPIGKPIRYDDFAFTVLHVEQAKSVGPRERKVRAYGTFWIVDLEVENRARRVGYRMDSHVPVLVDGEGRRIPVSTRGQAAVDSEREPAGGDGAMVPSDIGPGERVVTTIVFDVPEGAPDPRLKLVFGGAVGEALDFVFLGDRRFALR